MSDTTERTKSILAIAREPNAEKRQEALLAICRAFRSTPRGRAYEVQSFGEALVDLLDKLEDADRKLLSEHLAEAPLTPTYLLRRLAADRSPAVAAPVLASSTVLEDEDLLAAAKLGQSERLCALAHRKHLGAALEKALIASGDAATLTLLIGRNDIKNKDALLCAGSKAAAKNTHLARNLAQAGHLSAEHMADLYFQLDGKSRSKLMSVMEATAQSQDMAPANPDAANDLIAHLRAGKRKAFTARLCQVSGLNATLVEQAIDDPDGDGMAILCSALGIGRAVYSCFVTLTEAGGSNGEKRLATRLARYDTINPKAALSIVQAWRERAPALPKPGNAPVKPPGGSIGLPPPPANTRRA